MFWSTMTLLKKQTNKKKPASIKWVLSSKYKQVQNTEIPESIILKINIQA